MTPMPQVRLHLKVVKLTGTAEVYNTSAVTRCLCSVPSLMTQTTIDDAERKSLDAEYERILAGHPPQNNYEQIIQELLWMRRELEDFRDHLVLHTAEVFDATEISGRLATALIDMKEYLAEDFHVHCADMHD